MATINQLSSVDTLADGDQFPLFSEAQGDARKVSFETLKDAVADEFVGLDDLAAQTGAQLVGCNGGTTVQQELDALDTGKANLSALAASSGSSLVGFVQSGTGATARTVQAKARDTVSATDFGAVGDGSTVNTTALQAAIDAVAVAGGTVFLPAGAYVTGTLNLPSNVMLVGQGRFATRLVATAGLNAPLINRVGTISSVINRGGVANLAIVGSGKANTGMIGIKNVYTNRGTFRDIDIFACYRGMWIENVWQDALDNIHVHGGGADQNYMGFYFAPKAAVVGVSNAVIAKGCMAQGVEQWGFRIENGNGSKFTGCEASDGVHGWYIGDPSSGTETAEFMHFANCLGDTTSGHIWRIEKGGATALRRMHFSNCWAGNSTGGSGVYVAGASEITFTGWQVVLTELHGFHFNQSSRCPLVGSNIRDWNRPAGASNGVHLQDSLVIKVVGCEISSATLGTGKGFVEVGTSDSNALVASNSAAGWTILGGSTTQTGNTSL